MASLFEYTPHHSGGISRTVRIVLIAACITFIAGPGRSAFAADIDAAHEQFKTGKYTECLESSRKAIENGAYAAQWRVLMIKSLMALGQYDKAADDMDIVLLHYPVSMRLLGLAHTVYIRNDEPSRADEAIKRLVRVGTSRDLRYMSPIDLVALGNSLLLLGEEPRIVLDELFTRAIKNDPNCLDAYLAAGSMPIWPPAIWRWPSRITSWPPINIAAP